MDIKNIVNIGREKRIVVDVTNDHMHGMLVHRKGNKVEIIDVFSEKNTEKFYRGDELTNVEGLVDEIVRYCKEFKTKVKEIELVLDTEKLHYKIITLNGVDDKELPKVMGSEYDLQFPEVKKSLTTFDYESLGEFEADGVKGKKYLLGAFNDELGDKLLKEFKKHGYKLMVIDTELSVLKSALNAVGSMKSVKVGIHVGNLNAIFYVISHGKLVFMRKFKMSRDHLIHQVQKELGVGLKVAEDLVKDHGVVDNTLNEVSGSDSSESKVDLSSYYMKVEAEMESFTSEVFRSFDYVESTLKLELEYVYLTGSMVGVKGFKESVSRGIGAEVHEFEFTEETDSHAFDVVSKTSTKITDDYMRVFGLSLRGVSY